MENSGTNRGSKSHGDVQIEIWPVLLCNEESAAFRSEVILPINWEACAKCYFCQHLIYWIKIHRINIQNFQSVITQSFDIQNIQRVNMNFDIIWFEDALLFIVDEVEPVATVACQIVTPEPNNQVISQSRK